MTDDNTPLTHSELHSFVDALCRRLKTPPRDAVPPEDVIRLHSESLCEDGKTVMRLYDLANGRTGVQSFVQGETPGPIWCNQ
jgi:hypothetical protein